MTGGMGAGQVLGAAGAGRAGELQERGSAGGARGVGGRRMGRANGRRVGRADGRRAGAQQGTEGARQGRAGCSAWARGLATGCALGALGLFSIRFDLVFFLSRFWTLFVNPVHEHCSSQKSFEKKI